MTRRVPFSSPLCRKIYGVMERVRLCCTGLIRVLSYNRCCRAAQEVLRETTMAKHRIFNDFAASYLQPYIFCPQEPHSFSGRHILRVSADNTQTACGPSTCVLLHTQRRQNHFLPKHSVGLEGVSPGRRHTRQPHDRRPNGNSIPCRLGTLLPRQTLTAGRSYCLMSFIFYPPCKPRLSRAPRTRRPAACSARGAVVFADMAKNTKNKQNRVTRTVES